MPKFLNSIDLDKNELQNPVIHPLGSAPSNPKAGQVYYNTTDGNIYRYNGTSWVSYQDELSTAQAGTLSIDSSPTSGSSNLVTSGGVYSAIASVGGLPSQTGNNGKFLTTDGTDAGWAALPQELFLITATTSSNVISADKTYTEIVTAYTAGKVPVVSLNSIKIFVLVYKGSDYLIFTRASNDGYDSIKVDSSNVWTNEAKSFVNAVTSTDNAVPRFDGTGGALQDSGVTIGDTGHVYFPATAYWGGTSYLINTLGNAKLNLLGLGGAESVSGRALNVQGYTYHNGAVYFNSAALEDATTYRVDNNADARFRNVYAYRGRLYSYNESSSPSILTSYTIGGSVNDGRDASGTGVVDTLPQTASFGALIIRQAATRETYTNNVLQSTEYLRTQLWFRGYGVATSGADAGKIISSYREDYNLPAVDNDLTSSKSYNILTTKNTVTVAQGGTGATSFTANSVVMSGASTTAALTTRAVTNNTTSTALAANTNIPTMNTVKYGLDNRLNRTTAVNAADTGYTTCMARGISLHTSDTNPSVNGAITFTYQ